MSAALLVLIARIAVASSFGILVVLALRAPLRHAFGARVAYAAWLMAPLAALAAFLPARTITLTATATPQQTPVAQALEAAIAAPPAALAGSGVDFTPIVLSVWLAGAAICVAMTLYAHHRYLRRNDVGPAVVGVAAPRIVLPADFQARYTETERDLILAHERAHIAAGDAQINALAALAVCLNWYNPLFYLARTRFRIDQELACDERVLQRRPEARRAYAETMLKTQLAAQPIPLGCHWPPVGVRPLQERIAMLTRPTPSIRQKTAGQALCATATIALATAVWAAQPPRIALADEVQTQYGQDRDTRDAARGARDTARAARDSTRHARRLEAQLLEAAAEGRATQVRALIDAGADVNAHLPGDGTPLIAATRGGDRETIEVLLAAGANVNQAAPGDGNPLIVAAAEGNLGLAQLYLGRGADVNGFVSGDETPLINAARENRIAVAEVLINAGADVNLAVEAPTMRGTVIRSPLSEARRFRHGAMIQLLRQHGARP